MQAVKRFEPEERLPATYAMWWIKAAIQEYILRSWSLVKMGTTANQKKLFFNLRKAKSRISALDEGDVRPHFEARRLADEFDHVGTLADEFGVSRERFVRSKCAPSRRCRRRFNIGCRHGTGRTHLDRSMRVQVRLRPPLVRLF